MKEFLRWMAAGIGGVLTAVFQRLQAGGPVSARDLLILVASMVAYRAGAYLVAEFGPKPA